MRQWLRLMGSHCHLISPDLSTASTIVKMQIQILMQIRQKYNPTTNAALRGSERRKGAKDEGPKLWAKAGPKGCQLDVESRPNGLLDF